MARAFVPEYSYLDLERQVECLGTIDRYEITGNGDVTIILAAPQGAPLPSEAQDSRPITARSRYARRHRHR